jgi:aryl-alcohol dehydrogenase-like predicted oxidoreductase
MDGRRVGATEIEVSPIGLGTAQFAGVGKQGRGAAGTTGMTQETVQAVVGAAVSGGITWFDTAEAYGFGRSERALSTALRELDIPPGQVRIATKWMPVLRPASTIARTLDARLAALQGYPIDLHQIHMPFGSLSSQVAQLRAMARLVDARRISAIGVSNFSAAQMENASERLRSQGYVLASNEVQISLLHRKIESNGVLAAARRHGVTLIAYTPLKSGILTGAFHADPDRVRRVGPVRRRLIGLNEQYLERTRPLIEELRAVAQAYDVTPGQVALSWLVTFYGETVVAIPGASKPNQAKENAAVLDLRLTDRELARLAEVSRRTGAG